MIYNFDYSLQGQYILGDLDLSHAQFHGVLCLDNVSVEGDVWLNNITCYAHVSLKNAVFKKGFSLQNALLLGGLWVENTHFAKTPLLTHTQIHGRLHGVKDESLIHFGIVF